MSVPSPALSVDDVAGIVDDVGVVAGAAGHGVGAGPPSRTLLPRIAGEVLASALPVPLMLPAAGQGQVLDVGRRACSVTELSTVSVPWPASLGRRRRRIVDDSRCRCRRRRPSCRRRPRRSRTCCCRRIAGDRIASALPVPLSRALPVRVRFSTLAPSV